MAIFDRDAGLRSDPFGELERLSRRMNRLFGPARMSGLLDAFPPVNVWSNREKAVVTAEVPGVKKEDLNISVENDMLTMQGRRETEQPGAGESFRRHERVHGAFRRAVGLPFSVDPEGVRAECKDGILRLELPRHESSKPRRIEIG